VFPTSGLYHTHCTATEVCTRQSVCHLCLSIRRCSENVAVSKNADLNQRIMIQDHDPHHDASTHRSDFVTYITIVSLFLTLLSRPPLLNILHPESQMTLYHADLPFFFSSFIFNHTRLWQSCCSRSLQLLMHSYAQHSAEPRTLSLEFLTRATAVMMITNHCSSR
jgi:hypothetical protein